MNIKEKTVIKPLPDDLEIVKREEIWRLKLPIDYKIFIKKYNGGIPQEQSFNFNDHCYAVLRFLAIVKNIKENDLGCYDIDVIESQIGERLTNNMDLIGMKVVPIAELFGGDYVCLDFRESENPVVCIWYHEESGEFDPYTKELAISFEFFLEMLK